MPSHAKTLFKTLWYGELLDFYYILFKNNCKAVNKLFYSAECTPTRERVVLFPYLKILLEQSKTVVDEI
jgi:hypothetical protein